MATRTSPKAGGRKKVRCPKCTAFFTEPTKAVFECPICACRLSANGGNALMESPLREGGSGNRPDGFGNDEPNKMQSPRDLVKREEGNGTTQKGTSADFEQDSAAYHGQGYKKGEQELMRESSQNLNNGDTDGQHPVDSCTIEGTHGRNGILGPFPPVSKPGNSVEKNERGESSLPPPLSAGANKEAALVSTTGPHSPDDGLQENSLTVREESTDEGLEIQDCVISSGASSNQHLQAQMFRTTRGEFSFKYSVASASPLQSDGKFQRKKSSPPNATVVSSEATMPNVDASDMPLHTPLKVRIPKSHEESSDPSEHGRKSFSSETDSDDTSGSDFDFPSPWADGPQDIMLPAPFKGNEAFHPNLETVVSGAPHQLELQDVDENLDHEEITESGKHLKVYDTKPSSQVESAGKSLLSEVSHPVGLSQPDGKHRVLPDRSEIASRKLKPITSHNQSIDVGDLASYVSSSMQLGALGNHETVVMRDRTQKANLSGSQEGCAGEEEQEVGFTGNSQQDKLQNAESFMNVSKPEATPEPSGVLSTSDSQQVLKMKGYGTGTQESNDAGFANSARPATLPNQEYLWPKQSTPNRNPTDSSVKLHTILNTENFQMVGVSEKGNHPMSEGLLSSVHKIEHLKYEADARDGRTANHPVLTHVVDMKMETYKVDTEMEQDLYKLPMPHEIYRNDLYPPESSRSALWVEEEETSASAFSDDSTTKPKLYHEKKSSQKSLYGKKTHGNVGSRVIRSDNGEGQLFMPGEVRNLRTPGAGVSASLRATSELVDLEGGHINTAEGRSSPADLYGKPGSHSQLGGFPPVNPHPYAFANHPYGFAASGSTSQIYSYQLPAQSLMLPAAAFQNHALSHCGYHAVSSACILCSYHQHPHLPTQHMPQYGACCSPSSSIGYNPGGLVEHWNCHQANFGSASSCAGSLVDSPQARSSANQTQRYDFPSAESRLRVSTAKKYPPYPHNGAAPYVTCKGCTRVLQVPSSLPLNGGSVQKLRCGSCGKVTKFSAGGVVSNTFSPRSDSIGVAANMLPQTGAYGSYNFQLPISSATEIMKSSYKHDMIKGNPILHRSNEVLPQTRSPEQSPRGGEFCRVQPRGQAMDSSTDAYGQRDPSISASITGHAYLQNASGVAGAMSPRNTALISSDSFGFERSKVNHPEASYHLPVDEKEEGLDFGAPRISDGDSLDHSESQMRSPEYNQAGWETAHVDVSQGAALRGQVSDGNENDGTAGLEKKPGSPLLVLLNQESTRFRLNLEPRVTFEGAKAALWSPASDSVVYASSLPNRFQNQDQDNNPQSHGSPGHHFVSKGPKYIAGLLRRSLRDFGKGGGQ